MIPEFWLGIVLGIYLGIIFCKCIQFLYDTGILKEWDEDDVKEPEP